MSSKDHKDLFKTEEKIDDDGNQQFNLYTEKIVEKPSVKYRKLIKGTKFVARAVGFGAIACATFVVLYPWLSNIIGIEITTSKRTTLTIAKDEYPDEDSDSYGENESQVEAVVQPIATQDDDISDAYASLRQTMVTTRKSMVTIDLYKSDINDFFSNGTTSSQTVGVIIGEIDSEYIILTSYNAICNASSITAKFVDNKEAAAYVVSGDSTSDIAMLCVRQSDLSSYSRSQLSIAKLDNSYLVAQGDIVIAAGKLMGSAISVNYGVATNVKNCISGVDCYLGIINTNMMKASSDYGFLFNKNGNVIGIMQNNSGTDTTFNVYSISDLKSLIEEMSNGEGVVYCGITGRNVTNSISNQYGLPIGVYITDVAENSPAYDAGLQTGDVITKINEQTVLTFQTFSERLYQCSQGETITLNVKRLGKDEYKDIEFVVNLTTK